MDLFVAAASGSHQGDVKSGWSFIVLVVFGFRFFPASHAARKRRLALPNKR
jgi:hypothetical protein